MPKKLFHKTNLLLLQIFIVSTCSLVYELLIATTSTNITSNSIWAFSLVIGLFLAGLGSGAFFSQWVRDENLADTFIWNETLLALIGGFSVILLYSALVFSPYFAIAQVLLTFVIGLLSGLEIPILTRILNNQEDTKLKAIIAKVLSFDYLGGLAASLLFPLILLPYFGLVRLSFITGIINCLMSILGIYLFWSKIRVRTFHLTFSVISLILLITATIFSSSLYNFVESYLYRDPIIYSTQSQYQRIVLTKRGQDTRLYLNGGAQFSSLDEYRYHESLVMPGILNLLAQKEQFNEKINKNDKLKVAVFGGGDGLAVREILKFENYFEKIYLIDIDKKVTDLAQNTDLLKNLNQNSLNNPKVEIKNEDAWQWIQNQPRNSLDMIICDFPDPDETAIAKLYSQEFYRFTDLALTQSGTIVTQSSSPYSTPEVFWSINKTLESVFGKVRPYSAYIPSFGLWGYNLATKNNYWNPQKALENPTLSNIVKQNQFVDKSNLQKLFILELDILKPKLKNGNEIDLESLKINSLDNLILTNYYTQKGQEVS